MPLTIKRKKGEAIRIGPHITVTIGETRGSYTAIHIDAPKSLPVWRAEIRNFHAGGDEDGVCSGDISARTKRSVEHGISVTADDRTPD